MASPPPMIHGVDKLTNEIFSILENKFLFGSHDHIDLSKLSRSGKVRILSIDAAGSTHGVLAAKALLHLQSVLRSKSGNPTAHISDFFDVVTGAGTGGILAALLFTRGKDGSPMFNADESLRFIIDNHCKLAKCRHSGMFTRPKSEKVLRRVFGDLTLKDSAKAVLIPCYDLRTGAPFVFSRADALEVEGCDFRMAGVCEATLADRARELKSTDGTRKIVAVGGMNNPTAAAITHVLNNKQEFPLCKGVEDLLVISLGDGGSEVVSSPGQALAKIAADGAADMVDEAVAMAFGEWRRSNYVRIQGNRSEKKKMEMEMMADSMLGERNVESVLFKGKKVGEYSNMEKLGMFGVELVKEQERRSNAISIFQPVLLKNSLQYSPTRSRSSSSTSLSTLSS